MGGRPRAAAAALAALATLAAVIGSALATRPGPRPRSVHPPHAAAAPAAATPRLPTSARDFLVPGTQPGALAAPIAAPDGCANCHANYRGLMTRPVDAAAETHTAWSGSMMAHAARDPVFLAALDIANADAPGSGSYCLRCHAPAGWLAGRAEPPDGSALAGADLDGVSCGVCHRLVDPAGRPGHPARDAEVRAAITLPVRTVGSGALVVDPLDYRRGPRDLEADWRPGFNPHFDAAGNLVSPFHREAALCGSCHDIDNPLLAWDPAADAYLPVPPGATPPSDRRFPLERTYSEWRLSDFNRPSGVADPDLGGARARVATCQDCHMRAVDGASAGYFGEVRPRSDMALHDLTGANTWVPRMLPLDPELGAPLRDDPARAAALVSGTLRARWMLRHAAHLTVARAGGRLSVTVVNRAGHKLPTGYSEGRRMWLQVEAFDRAGRRVFVSGAYDDASATLAHDPALKVYEVLHGLTPAWADRLGLAPGPTFHFAVNNVIVSDNRIPPRGYAFDAFEAAGAAPYADGRADRARYADGQHWDTTVYDLPPSAATGRVRLLYQTASAEYIAFLRDANPNPAPNRGQTLYDLWERTGRSAPEVMAERRFGGPEGPAYLPVAVRGTRR